MQVLKFGGTSVANAGNINKVVSVVKDSMEKGKTIVVVSAMGGVTDLLLAAASFAAEGNEIYKEKLELIEQRHLEAVKELIPVARQSQLLSLVKKSCNEIEDICNGIFLLGELTPRSKDRIGSYGEWISSQIVAAKFRAEGIEADWKDSRQLIITNGAFTMAEVDHAVLKRTFSNISRQVQHHCTFCPDLLLQARKA